MCPKPVLTLIWFQIWFANLIPCSFKQHILPSRLRGATVARPTPDRKVACSNHVGVIGMFFCWTICVLFEGNISPSVHWARSMLGVYWRFWCLTGEMLHYFVVFPLKSSGSAEIWTRITGFKVQSANHYTTEPHFSLHAVFLESMTNICQLKPLSGEHIGKLSQNLRFCRDLNSDRRIQSPEC